MNPLLEQFLTEARDLLDTAGEGLLGLERSGGDPELVNTVFRAVHTLKGTSGLFEIAPLTALVHAGEDLLDAVRDQRLKLTGEMVDLLLAALDQTRAWLEDLERSETLPDGAAEVAAARAKALRALLSGPAAAAAGAAAASPQAPCKAPGWVAGLAAAARDAAEQAARAADRDIVAVEYRPGADCFFAGEDPLQLARQTPELVMLHIVQPEAWAPAALLDPLQCQLSFQLLSVAPLEDVRHIFRYCDDVEIVAYAPLQTLRPDHDVIGELVDAQLRMLGQSAEPELAAGRAAAAAGVLRRIARHAGLALDEPALAAATAAAAEGRREALAALLQGCRPARRPEPAEPRGGAAEAAQAPGAELRAAPLTTLRVEQSKIDTLMNLIGELIIAKNSLAYLARKAEAGASARELARDIKDQHAVVNRLAEDMQSAVMAIRMLPVSHIFQRFPRLVRDISRKLGKQVELVLEGEETEADKNMIEALSDPLIHMVRNSLDHGLEPAEQRLATGKPEQGTLRLAAKQENECIIVAVSDDGRGIDPARIRSKAVERGMLDAEAAAALSDEEAVRLVFAAGFSTAEQISDLSGRGVGMDVVRSAIEKVGGRVDLQSRLEHNPIILVHILRR
ncbi:chemotaxis protein CheA [Roseomonas sp. USHLN139]|uniref:chemotaxis protein CheA n=1 Tax=Roseomonas sp. USHLN139 TaxID=3081298 RepID=UPI003B010582